MIAGAGELGPAERQGAFASLRHRDFAVFWATSLLSNAGSWMQAVTIPFVVDQLTHSTAAVGVAIFLYFAPTALAGPVGGSFADRHSRRSVLLWSQGVMMLAAFGLWGLWVSGEATSANLLVCVVVSAVATGMSQPALFAFVTQLVPRDSMFNAIRLNSMQNQAARAIGPGIAGLVLATLGPGAAFLINGLSFVVVLVGLFIIPARPVGDSGPATKVSAHFRDGVRYVRERRVLATVTLTVLISVLLGQGGVIQLVEPFTRHVLHAGAGLYGVLVGANAVGAISGTLLIAYRDRWPRATMILVGMGIYTSAEIAFALAPGYAFALGAMIVAGAMFSVCMISLQMTLQANVSEAYRGRVLSIYLMAAYVAAPLGALVSGVIGDVVGLRATFVGASTALIVYVSYAYFRFDHLRLFDQSLAHTEQIRSETHG